MISLYYKYLLLCNMASYDSKEFQSAPPDEIEFHKKNKKKLLSSGWTPAKNSEDLKIGDKFGYFGVCYVNINDDNSVKLVFAHRGTCFNKEGNLLADLAIAQIEYPRILEEAFLYVRTMLTTFEKANIKITKITHTGFSLGGFIAGVCAASSSEENVFGFTFDAPGIKGFLEKNATSTLTAKKAENLINYVIEPNIVNTGGAHFGKIKEMSFYTKGIKASNSVHLSAYFSQAETLPLTLLEIIRTGSRHNLTNIIKKSFGGTHFECTPVYDWPVAKNKFTTGQKPKPEELLTYGDGGVMSSLFSFGIGLSQMMARGTTSLYGTNETGFSQFIWDMTNKSSFENGGIVSFEHKRENLVFYSKEDYDSHHSKPTVVKFSH